MEHDGRVLERQEKDPACGSNWKPDLPVQAWAKEASGMAPPHAGVLHTYYGTSNLYTYMYTKSQPSSLQGKTVQS